MYTEAVIIFPHHLFEHHPALTKERDIYLIEHPRFFTDFSFHKQKLILHRATLQMYKDFLITHGYHVRYYTYNEHEEMWKHIFTHKIQKLHVVEFIDNYLEQFCIEQTHRMEIELIVYPSPAFVTPISILDHHFKNKKVFRMAPFYTMQRKRLSILVQSGSPVGGKWSFDMENRKKLPKDIRLPRQPHEHHNKYIQEARLYVAKKFSHNPGHDDEFIYPVTFTTARSWLHDFLTHRLKYFGDYEDTISPHHPYLFHSVLSPLLNIGLLTPAYVIEAALQYAHHHHTPLNSLEGFVRQIIGWREFMRAVYLYAGEQQRASNFFHHTKKLTPAYWRGTTGITPVDDVIQKILTYGYAHHIERLMILGNWMLINETHPREVYTWFMSLFIDAYDWVMVPNIFGMSQYADGGLMTTKPYFSSSNYIRTMSSYKKENWCDEWDSKFWNFMTKHTSVFRKNPRLAMLIKRHIKKK